MKYTESTPQNTKTFNFASIFALLKVPVNGNMSENYGNTFELSCFKRHGDKASCETQCALHIGLMVRSASKETHMEAENIARVRNCPDVTKLNSLFSLGILSFCLFIFLSLCLFVQTSC